MTHYLLLAATAIAALAGSALFSCVNAMPQLHVTASNQARSAVDATLISMANGRAQAPEKASLPSTHFLLEHSRGQVIRHDGPSQPSLHRTFRPASQQTATTPRSQAPTTPEAKITATPLAVGASSTPVATVLSDSPAPTQKAAVAGHPHPSIRVTETEISPPTGVESTPPVASVVSGDSSETTKQITPAPSPGQFDQIARPTTKPEVNAASPVSSSFEKVGSATAESVAEVTVEEVQVVGVEVIPSKPLSVMWDVSIEDGNVRRALARWAMKAGWVEHWELEVDIPLTANATIATTSDFTEAVSSLADAVALSETPFRPCFYSNKVVRILPYNAMCDRTMTRPGRD